MVERNGLRSGSEVGSTPTCKGERHISATRNQINARSARNQLPSCARAACQISHRDLKVGQGATDSFRPKFLKKENPLPPKPSPVPPIELNPIPLAVGLSSARSAALALARTVVLDTGASMSSDERKDVSDRSSRTEVTETKMSSSDACCFLGVPLRSRT